ncbi:MAG TPA: FimV/HubP family polar landmark protein [Steroidobacteraceae bacterium]|nr:FimV/HubP family polar landmark protein [Steroidobacteraceae bacterium]
MIAKSLRWALVALAVAAPAAMALGLGDIHLHSALNAPLDADIDLIGATPDELSTVKAQLAPRDAFTRNGLEWQPVLSSVTMRVAHTADGRDIIKVTSSQPITEPFVTFLAEIVWARGDVTHEYTLLLDPPVYAPGGSAAAPVAAPTTAPAARSGRVQTAPSPAGTDQAQPSAAAPAAGSATAETAPPAATAASAEGPPGTYTVDRGDTLSRITAKLSGAASASGSRRWMVAAYRENPAAFEHNMNRLRAGTVLRLPDAAAVSAVSAAEALTEIRSEYAAWRAAPTGAAQAAGNAPAGAAAAPAGGAEQGRLRLVTPGSSPGAGTGAGTAASAAAASSEVKSLQAQIQSLNAQLRNADAQLDEQKRLLALRDAALQKLQDQLKASRANRRQAEAQQTQPPPPVAGIPAPAKPPAAAPATPAATQPPPASPAPPTPVTSASASHGPAAAQKPQSAAAGAPAHKHPKVHSVPVAPASSGSLLGSLLQYWWVLAAAAVVVAGWFGYRAWQARRPAVEEPLEGFAESDPAHDATLPIPSVRRDDDILVEETGTHRPAPAARSVQVSHVTAEQGDAEAAAVNLEQGDPLAEADFHMAYGLYDQAADLVRLAIQREPNRRDLRLKLLEVFFVWGNKEQFLEAAHGLAQTRDQGPPGEWEKIVIMGKQLAPDDALFAGGTGSGAAAGGVDLDLADGQGNVDFDVMGGTAQSNGLDLDIGSALGERDATAEQAASGATDKNLALNLNELDLSGGTGATAEMPGATSTGSTMRMPSNAEPTVQNPALGQDPTIREKLAVRGRSGDQTAELAMDDLGLDLSSLETGDHAALPGNSADAPTMVAGLDEHSRRLLETASHRAVDGADAAPDEDATQIAALNDQGPGLDFDLGSTGSMAAAAPSLSPVDLDLGGGAADAHFTTTQTVSSVELALPELEPATMSEVGTKLDLARAYMDMGDPEGARNILEEVVSEGSVAQKQEAQRLIESLPG